MIKPDLHLVDEPPCGIPDDVLEKRYKECEEEIEEATKEAINDQS